MKITQIFLALVASVILMSSSCEEVLSVANDILVTDSTSTANPLSNSEVIAGLKEALSVGTNNSSSLASALDGFNGNPKIRLPFPEDAQKVKDKAIDLGLQGQVDKFELTMNRAAEEASKEAGPIFFGAITNMTIGDGFKILKGEKNAATQYLIDNTSANLRTAFQPKIKDAIDKVELTKYWNPIIDKYNIAMAVTGGDKMNPDLEDYITGKAMDGLFSLIAEEELKIRDNPAARVSDLLKRVFGSITGN